MPGMSSTPLSQTLQTTDGVTVSFPAGWSAKQEENLYSLYSVTADELPTADLEHIARIVISTEQHADHEEALGRLSTIQAESDVTATSLTVGGWPALQRCQVVSTPQPGDGDEMNGSDRTVRVVTTAIAAAAMVVRLEGTIPVDAALELIGEVSAIGQSVVVSADGTSSSTGQQGIAGAEDAGGSIAGGTLFEQVLETDQGYQLTYPDGWSADKVANLYMIFSVPAPDLDSVDLDEIVQVVVHTERHADHAAAAARLTQIASESDTPSTRLDIDGWPALERTQIGSAPQPGSPGMDGAGQQVLSITTAVAGGNLLVRLESKLPPDANLELVEQVLAIGRSLTFKTTDPTD